MTTNFGFDPNVPALLTDFQDGLQWPPTRLAERVRVFAERDRIAAGDYSMLIEDAEDRTVVTNRIGAYLDTVSALLMATDPGSNFVDAAVRQQLQNMLDNAARDACTHGKGLMLTVGDRMLAPPISNAFPLGDTDAWLFIEPRVTPESEDGRANILQVTVWENGSLGGVLYEFTPSSQPGVGQIGRQVGELTPAPAQLVDINKPPTRCGWGTSDVDELCSITAQMVRRDSAISYILDRNERPLFAVYANTSDIPAVRELLDVTGADIGDPLNAQQMREWAPSLRRHDIAIYPDGITNAEYLSWDGALTSSFDFSDKLERDWSLLSGMAPVESGDSAEVASGVAIARRNFRLTAKVARLHGALYAAAEQLVGPFEWPYVGVDDSGGKSATPILDEMADAGIM